jgi:hypothetical protein
MAEPTLPPCPVCGELTTAGKGWIRDAQGRPMHLRCSELGLPCALCSKPVLPRTGLDVAGRLVHARCLARETRLQAMAERDRAGQGMARSRTLIERTREAIARAKGRTWHCAVCGRPLKDGTSLLFQGSELVHASCWQGPADDPLSPSTD